MDQFWIATIRNYGRPKQGFGYTCGELRQKTVKPSTKLRPAQHPTHQVCFHQSRREKVFAPGFPTGGIIGVLCKICSASFGNEGDKLFVTCRRGIIKGERQP